MIPPRLLAVPALALLAACEPPPPVTPVGMDGRPFGGFGTDVPIGTPGAIPETGRATVIDDGRPETVTLPPLP